MGILAVVVFYRAVSKALIFIHYNIFIQVTALIPAVHHFSVVGNAVCIIAVGQNICKDLIVVITVFLHSHNHKGGDLNQDDEHQNHEKDSFRVNFLRKHNEIPELCIILPRNAILNDSHRFINTFQKKLKAQISVPLSIVQP